MDDMNGDPLERQVANVTQRAVGPERHVEALAIARYAAASGRSRPNPFAGALRFAMGAAVVVLVGAVLVFSGVLRLGEEDALVGTSPSPSTSPGADADARSSADKVIYASGSIGESLIDVDTEEMWRLLEGWDRETMEAVLGEGYVDIPFEYPVTATDPRLAGRAIVVTAAQELIDTLSVSDADDTRPRWELETRFGRMRITNDAGTWEGSIGSYLDATGEEPIDDIPGNAPGLSAAGPAVLQGGGDYRGLTAYLWFDGATAPGRTSLEIGGADFEALITNAPPFDVIPQDVWEDALAWLDEARQVSAAE
jgi:hypothetical protein